MICLITFEYISKIKYLNRFLKIIGEHSFNIFLFHTFIYYFYFKEFIYSFKNSFVIFIVLLGVGLVVSKCVEAVKKLKLKGWKCENRYNWS